MTKQGLRSSYSSQAFPFIKDTLEDSEYDFAISELCNVMEVSRSGFYRWNNTTQARLQKDKDDFQLIQQAYRYRGYKKGARSTKFNRVQTE